MSETLGSTEALLQLLSAYQGSNGLRPTPNEIWSQIAGLLKRNAVSGRHQLEWYFTNGELPAAPPATFFADLEELLRKGLVVLGTQGGLEVTAAGQFYAFARTLPADLLPIQHKLAEVGKEKSRHHH